MKRISDEMDSFVARIRLDVLLSRECYVELDACKPVYHNPLLTSCDI